MSTDIEPWLDTALCAKCDGPVCPFVEYSGPPHRRPDARHVNCAVCGHDYIETDAARLARIWWSFGAWEAKKAKR